MGAFAASVRCKEDNCYPFAAVFDADTVADSSDGNLGNRRLPMLLFFPLGSVGTVGKALVVDGDSNVETALAVPRDSEIAESGLAGVI